MAPPSVLASESRTPLTTETAAALYRRITWRVAPLLVLLYLVAFLDRVNISFASLTMNHDLHIGDDLFGLAAGIFFIGYLLFAVPSNMMLTRFGARRWIAVLMITWGVFSGGMAFVQGAGTYVSLRFLVGAAEAGFFPGVILYLSQWLPGSARARIMALFTLSIPLSNVIGAPISAAILRVHVRSGLAGWQWLFLLEAIPAVLLGCLVPWLLPAGPQSVTWLTTGEKRDLAEAMAREAPPAAVTSGVPVRALLQPALVYFAMMVGLYALGFWVPRLLASHGVTLAHLGWRTALPFGFGAVGMLAWGAASDRTGERTVNVAAALGTAGCGMVVTAMAPNTAVALAGLSVAAIGIFAAMPIFWAQFSQRIAPGAAAIGIAVVNSVGNIGGFLGPLVTGWLLKHTHGFGAGLCTTAGCLVCGALLLLVGRQAGRARVAVTV